MQNTEMKTKKEINEKNFNNENPFDDDQIQKVHDHDFGMRKVESSVNESVQVHYHKILLIFFLSLVFAICPYLWSSLDSYNKNYLT